MGTVHAKAPETTMESHRTQFEGTSNDTDPNFKFDIRTVPVKVDRIVIDGVGKTKNDILEKTLKPVLSATNFKEMVEKSTQAKILLEKLELFKKVDILIDTNKEPNASANGYEVQYHVEERKYPILNVKMELGAHSANESDVVVRMKYPNMFGRGESCTLDYSRVFKDDGGYGFQFSKPINGDPDIRIGTNVYKGYAEFPWSSFKEISRGTALHLMFPTILGSHCLKWEGVWREMRALNRNTSFAVREQAGHTLKSSIQHVLMRDRRDDKILPTKGYLVKLTQEYAGLGGNVEFVKNDVELQYNLPLVFDSIIQLSLAGGILTKIDQNKDIKINDRYFLGGPLTLRGFTVNGVGPHSDGNALGADAYWLSGLHLYTPLPFRPGKGGFGEMFRSHFFVTAGNLGNVNLMETAKENLKNLTETFRLSYGLGVVLRLGGIARLEINYVIPVRSQIGDNVDRGFQYGIGISFL
ncbi:sorting and assembly machinery component 50 homolog [Mytilus trossulus]|uniref:sorting and assembly machinery component 50 homolog n=1 Tax=Mytilus trossulus TaxID=6551 RepID=UPI003004C0AD